MTVTVAKCRADDIDDRDWKRQHRAGLPVTVTDRHHHLAPSSCMQASLSDGYYYGLRM